MLTAITFTRLDIAGLVAVTMFGNSVKFASVPSYVINLAEFRANLRSELCIFSDFES